MMSLADILQLVVLCALLFFPLGYLTRHYQRRIRTTLRLMFFKTPLRETGRGITPGNNG